MSEDDKQNFSVYQEQEGSLKWMKTQEYICTGGLYSRLMQRPWRIIFPAAVCSLFESLTDHPWDDAWEIKVSFSLTYAPFFF